MRNDPKGGTMNAVSKRRTTTIAAGAATGMLILGGIAISGAGPASASSESLEFFQDVNYGNQLDRFGGDYRAIQMPNIEPYSEDYMNNMVYDLPSGQCANVNYGNLNDQISSIKNHTSRNVVLYLDANCQGASFTLAPGTEHPALTWSNDKISSFRA